MRRRMESLVGILSVADGAEEARLRARVALITLHIGSIAEPDGEATDRQRRDAALRIARELVGAR